mmetsp:Transcript_15206/g.23967  ORF Transcript_15206/g.23967 Transcript_15206/m.23967 type:complete len:195 (-) Transcript_15206:391-975(-)
MENAQFKHLLITGVFLLFSACTVSCFALDSNLKLCQVVIVGRNMQKKQLRMAGGGEGDQLDMEDLRLQLKALREAMEMEQRPQEEAGVQELRVIKKRRSNHKNNRIWVLFYKIKGFFEDEVWVPSIDDQNVYAWESESEAQLYASEMEALNFEVSQPQLSSKEEMTMLCTETALKLKLVPYGSNISPGESCTWL